MPTYKLYKAPFSGQDEAVKVGFSWPGFFFTFIWMFVKGLQGFGWLWLLMTVVLRVTEAAAGGSIDLRIFVFLGYLLLSWIPGNFGNNWRTKHLENRGFDFIKEVQAENPVNALGKIAEQEVANKSY